MMEVPGQQNGHCTYHETAASVVQPCSVVVKTTPTETKTLPRPESTETETRPRHLEVETETRPRLLEIKINEFT